MVADISEIVTSVKAGGALIKDDFIRSGKLQSTPNGRLLRYVGGFSVVFPFVVGSDKWAFRCWHSDVGVSSERLKALSLSLPELKKKCPYFDEFVYVDERIVVNGVTMPTTRMKWVEGQNLKEYIVCHNDRDALLRLAADFKKMVETMHECKVSHGDLQHGNIIVDSHGGLHLIDYDGVFLPSFVGRFDDDIVKGKVEYQHPGRNAAKKMTEKTDYFSELVIYTAIVAMAIDSTLVEKYNVKDTDGLLFKKEDFADFENSQVCKELSAMGGLLNSLIVVFKEYLSVSDIDELCFFPDRLAELNKPVCIKEFEADRSFTLPGIPIELKWAVEGYVGEVVITPMLGAVEAKGTRTLTDIEKDTTFAIVVKHLDGEVRKSITIRVLPMPVVKCAFVPTPSLSMTMNVKLQVPQFKSPPVLPSVRLPFKSDVALHRMELRMFDARKIAFAPPSKGRSLWEDLRFVIRKHFNSYNNFWHELFKK